MDMLALEKPEESTYLNCIRCGLCLAVCPTYREYLKETVSPRGRVALARQGLDGQLGLSPNLVEQMYNCFACMACNEICPEISLTYLRVDAMVLSSSTWAETERVPLPVNLTVAGAQGRRKTLLVNRALRAGGV